MGLVAGLRHEIDLKRSKDFPKNFQSKAASRAGALAAAAATLQFGGSRGNCR
jgi:hypothetical protein